MIRSGSSAKRWHSNLRSDKSDQKIGFSLLRVHFQKRSERDTKGTERNKTEPIKNALKSIYSVITLHFIIKKIKK